MFYVTQYSQSTIVYTCTLHKRLLVGVVQAFPLRVSGIQPLLHPWLSVHSPVPLLTHPTLDSADLGLQEMSLDSGAHWPGKWRVSRSCVESSGHKVKEGGKGGVSQQIQPHLLREGSPRL